MWNDTDLNVLIHSGGNYFYSCIPNVKDKVRSKTVHEGPEGA